MNNILKKVTDGDIVDGYYTIPDGVEIINQNTGFWYNKRIRSVYIPKSVRIIDTYAFQRCDNLTTVIFEEGLQRIESAAFWGCKSMSFLKFPASLQFLGNDVFEDCISLQEVVIPANSKLPFIGLGVFNNCKNLRRIYLASFLSVFSSFPEGVEQVWYKE